ncbi:ribonuclease T2 [Sphingobium subterraneum]|uniref:Ribonuclease T2 n=1 Tax=Sphingobium subterraneum TaxID=627688 RepID=A0A841J4U8_9SPHN|nr:ribonuclease T2 [Sphingobium subterraneum]MBB6124546.1 ribonuclease T2 [Sphingobium subterraneum]
MKCKAAAVALLLAGFSPVAAHAQATACAVPYSLPRPRPVLPGPGEARRVLPIGGYTLTLSWTPQFCAGPARYSRDAAMQCGGAIGRFGFILHGLWPEGTGRQWPQFCAAAPLVPPQVLGENLCVTPSVQLMQHEWAKHGSCMARDADAYFDRARGLYQRLRFPDMQALVRRKSLTAADVADAFSVRNPGIERSAIRLQLGRGGWLEEVWVCLGTGFAATACPAGKPGVNGRQPVRIRS